MFTWLVSGYQIIFWSRAKRLAYKLLSEKASGRAVVLREVGLPNGGETFFQWWEDAEGAKFRRVDRDFSTEKCIGKDPTHVGAGEFEELFAILTNSSDLKGFDGGLTDGIRYSLIWGTRRRLFELLINNPEPGSRHAVLIECVLAHAGAAE